MEFTGGDVNAVVVAAVVVGRSDSGFTRVRGSGVPGVSGGGNERRVGVGEDGTCASEDAAGECEAMGVLSGVVVAFSVRVPSSLTDTWFNGDAEVACAGDLPLADG